MIILKYKYRRDGFVVIAKFTFIDLYTFKWSPGGTYYPKIAAFNYLKKVHVRHCCENIEKRYRFQCNTE